MVTLTYNKRESFLKGLDDLIAKPVLSMEHEFGRDESWVDWKSRRYTLKDEWAYVNGKASRKVGCTPGTRDDNNDAKTPQDFMARVNGFIQERRNASYGVLLTEDHAFLTMEEVLAVRLCEELS